MKISHGLAEFIAGRTDARTKFTGMVSFEPLSFFKLTLYLKPSLIVRKLVKNHELDLRSDSVEELGSVVRFWAPGCSIPTPN